MATPGLGRWEPLSVSAAAALFRDAPCRWWISGGRALELHLGRSWRDHQDTDVGVTRRDASAVRTLLDRWDIHLAAAGVLAPWHGEALVAARHENNLWCRRHVRDPWRLDVTVGEGDGVTWIYRRDRRLRVPWGEAVLATADGIPYLAPELQLLFKSKNPRPKDDVDAGEVIPELEPGRGFRLAGLLPLDHPWRRYLPAPPGINGPTPASRGATSSPRSRGEQFRHPGRAMAPPRRVAEASRRQGGGQAPG
jgi:hypothetical protein